MYSYEWDAETGGLILNTTPNVFSKEPRPVYYEELDILGFDKYWTYTKDDSYPYMWVEANIYYYYGKKVAMTKGGSLYVAPELIILDEPEPEGQPLRFVDIGAMVVKNAEIMDSLVKATIKKVYNIYVEQQKKIDVFYVAFSGGKDSVVALDIVQKALPHNAFKVIFGDTGMEFPDTYNVIAKVQELCKETGIAFYIAKSHLNSKETWKEFGPPSQILRWCCSVHKTAPQILLLRETLNKPNFTGMAFTGIRGDESVSRSEYEDVSLGEKHRGQYSCHPIIEWNSAEVFLYIYGNSLVLNKTYLFGNSRAGCLVCPMATNRNIFFKEQCYSHCDNGPSTTDFNTIILETTVKSFNSQDDIDSYMNISGWKARRSGKELKVYRRYCSDSYSNGLFKVEISRERTSWKEWIKTLGEVIQHDENCFFVVFDKKIYEVSVLNSEESTVFTVPIKTNSNSDIHFMAALKVVCRKAAYCIGCRVCEANCPYGNIAFIGNQVHISEDCISCLKCHEISHGCLVSNSLRLPKSEGKNMRSIDRYFNMGVEFNWVVKYFAEPSEFFTEKSIGNDLGSKKIIILRRFLEDAGITKENQFNSIGEIISKIGIDSESAWGLILANLSYTPEFYWYIKNITVGQTYTVDALKMLIPDDMTNNSKKNIVEAFKNIFISNAYLGKRIGLGICDYEEKNQKKHLNSITRHKWLTPDPLVILFSLYKFAEACDGYYQFTLSRLLNHEINSDGVSPTEIFSLDRDTMERILKGLSVNYSDYISASFTLDLDNVSLNSMKSSADVLKLF